MPGKLRAKPPLGIGIIFLCGIFLLFPAASEAVVVRDAAQLAGAVHQANAGGDRTIVLEDGIYTLDEMLWIDALGVTVQSLSGNRESVIIQGRGMDGPTTHVFNIAASYFTVRDVSLRRVSQHAVQLQPDVDHFLIRNVHILDTGEQMLKVAYDPRRPDLSSDHGTVEWCLFEYSAGIGPQWYIGGIDAHSAKNWVVRGNTFIGNRGHTGGVIRNNMIYHDATEGFADVGIALESAPGAQVYHNTVFQRHGYPNAIEYRFAATIDVLIVNNLANRVIARRDGASAVVSHNITVATEEWFVDSSAPDLHLTGSAAPAVDQGTAVLGLDSDFDGDPRPYGAGYDIGADEYSGLWNGSRHWSGDWRWLAWFGIFNLNNDPWIRHENHGWLYPFGTDTSSIWFWDVAMTAYWWTSESTYPHVYRSEPPGGTWLYYHSGVILNRLFYNYTTLSWETW